MFFYDTPTTPSAAMRPLRAAGASGRVAGDVDRLGVVRQLHVHHRAAPEEAALIGPLRRVGGDVVVGAGAEGEADRGEAAALEGIILLAGQGADEGMFGNGLARHGDGGPEGGELQQVRAPFIRPRSNRTPMTPCAPSSRASCCKRDSASSRAWDWAWLRAIKFHALVNRA